VFFLSTTAKHFIVDDICCYLGSQNLYICDLAEWGVVIDKEDAVKKIKAEYWDEMWKISYTKDECDVDSVMDGLKIDRSAPSKMEMTKIQMEQAKERMRASRLIPKNSAMHAKEPVKTEIQKQSESDDESEVSEGEDIDEC
jgi:phosphatidylserine/phosphatidylglycerophosphate/cardiolipin synthase-like enzyme